MANEDIKLRRKSGRPTLDEMKGDIQSMQDEYDKSSDKVRKNELMFMLSSARRAYARASIGPQARR